MRRMRLGTEVVVTTPADCLQLDETCNVVVDDKVPQDQSLEGIDWLFLDKIK